MKKNNKETEISLSVPSRVATLDIENNMEEPLSGKYSTCCDKNSNDSSGVSSSPSNPTQPPISKLVCLLGKVANEEARVLKDDGCNTNVLSVDFVN